MKNPAYADLHLASLLARHLLSPSPRFENAPALRQAAARDGMRCLGALDKPTRLSLPALPPESATKEAVTAAAEVAANLAAKSSASAASPAPQAPMTPEPPRFGTTRPEYSQALGDTSVVDALLHFHARARPGAPPLAGFRKEQIAQIDRLAQQLAKQAPKTAPSTRPAADVPRATRTTTGSRVFRSRGE